MGCHHEISNGRGVAAVINAGGIAGGCSFCKADALQAELSRLRNAIGLIADSVESHARAHKCMGIDCSICWPQGTAHELRALLDSPSSGQGDPK